MKKIIPAMVIAIAVLVVILLAVAIWNTIAGRPSNDPAQPSEASHIPANTANSTAASTESTTGRATESPATPGGSAAESEGPTATPEPVFSAVIRPALSGDNAASVNVSLSGNLILAEYPMPDGDAAVRSLKLSIDGENIASADYPAEGFTAWTSYPVKVTDTGGLSREYVLTFRPAAKKLPVVSIYTDAPVETRTEYVTGTLYVNGDSTEDFAGKNLDGVSIKIRGRGNASWSMTDKKSYRIKLDEKASVLGLRKNRDWVLVSTYFDKSLIRNIVAHNMAQTMEHLYYTPTHVAVDLFMNGKYVGVYTVADKIEEADHKLTVSTGKNPAEPGFLIEIGWDYSQPYVRDKDYFDTDVIIRLFVKEPDVPYANAPEILYIKDYIRKTEQAILAGEGYEQYLDVDSMVDWFIITELTNNTEMAFYRSCYMYKPEGGKLIMGPVWDFDMAFGNHSGDIPGYDGWASAEATYWLVNDTWATYLVKDPAFMEKVKARWLEKRDLLLQTAFATVDRQYALVSPSAELNFKVWDNLTKQVGEGAVDYTVYNTYEKQVQYVREFVAARAAWIDNRLELDTARPPQ
ncbi:MAG: CotH kinase family protein [Clostridia bacterium]|nr:CotH kinase family protein [Clostridia bacterium]